MTSSATQSLTHAWLRKNIIPYTHPDPVFDHVDAALTRHPTIRPKTDVYTYDDGRSQLLLCLHGLLPISFRRASYNIPIALWLPRDYPRTPPIPYVVPTSDMLIRPGPDIDPSGRVSGQYIRNWQRKTEACSLVGVLDAMHDMFSHQPPVYAKPNAAAPLTDHPQRPPPPLPVDRAASVGISHEAHTPARGPPPLPAKPIAPGSFSAPPQASTSIQAAIGTPVLVMRPPPPLPPQTDVPKQLRNNAPSYFPGRDAAAQLSFNNPPWAARMPSSSHNQAQSLQPSHQAAVPTPSPPPPPPPLPPALSASISAATSPVSFSSTSHQAYPTPLAQNHLVPVYSPPPQSGLGASVASPPYASGQSAPPPPFPPLFAPPPHTLPPHASASIASTPPDLLDQQDGQTAGPSAPATVPPRPPNPELLRLHDRVHAKLTSELASLSQVMALDGERLRANQTDLLAGEPAIRDEMARLEAVRDVCNGVAARLEQVVLAGERNVAELRRKGDPEVDEMVCSTTIVYNQLINLVAEDNAIEDTIYHLHRALNAGRVDLERFLRTTRVLAEEQYMKRALIEKIQTRVPLHSSDDGAAWAGGGLRQW